MLLVICRINKMDRCSRLAKRFLWLWNFFLSLEKRIADFIALFHMKELREKIIFYAARERASMITSKGWPIRTRLFLWVGLGLGLGHWVYINPIWFKYQVSLRCYTVRRRGLIFWMDSELLLYISSLFGFYRCDGIFLLRRVRILLSVFINLFLLQETRIQEQRRDDDNRSPFKSVSFFLWISY